MGRRQPRVLLEDEGDDGRPLTIIDCPGVWILTYNGQPIQVRKGLTTGYPGPKYLRITWTASPAHAINMARRLNARFNTEAFGVSEITEFRPIDDDWSDEWFDDKL